MQVDTESSFSNILYGMHFLKLLSFFYRISQNQGML